MPTEAGHNWHVCLPSTKELEAKVSIGLAGKPVYQNCLVQGLVRSPVSKYKVEKNLKSKTLYWWGGYKYMYSSENYRYEHIYTNILKKTICFSCLYLQN